MFKHIYYQNNKIRNAKNKLILKIYPAFTSIFLFDKRRSTIYILSLIIAKYNGDI